MSIDTAKHTLFIIGALGSLLFFLIGCGQNTQPEQGEIVAAPPTATLTATPFPSATPTNTPSPTPLPTATSTPLPTTTPLPEVVLEVSGPEIIPAGLPQAAEWRVSVVSGAELVIVSIDDLGGVMLSGDEADQLPLVKSLVPAAAPNVALSFDSEWVIRGIVDPNIGRGVLTLLIETSGFQETVTLPWVSSTVADIQSQTYVIAMDGVNQEPLLDPESAVQVSRPGFNRYETVNGVVFEYPQAWFVNEFQDGIIQLSPDPLAAADGATPADVPYASIIAGDRATVGVPLNIAIESEAIIDWLLGDVVATGGSESGLFLSNELEVTDRSTADLEDGSTATTVVLRPVDDDQANVEARLIVTVKADDRIIIVTGFDPDGDFFADLTPTINSLTFK